MSRFFKGLWKGMELSVAALFYKVVYTFRLPRKKWFKVGDEVEDYFEHSGVIWKIYRREKTNIPIACSIKWHDSSFSLYVPFVEDKGKNYNPHIRRRSN